MNPKKITLLLIFLNSLLTSEKIKEIEKCLLESLNPTDTLFKYTSDLAKLDIALTEFPLFPKSLQKKFRDCKIKLDEKKICEEIHGIDNCEQCGMLYKKKCPENFSRIDCGLCVRNCPEKTVEDALGALCAKPKIFKKKIYNSFIDCKKDGNEDCNNFGDFATSLCPKYFKAIGDFLCGYECPEGFEDSEIYCVPEILESNEYFMGNYAGKLDLLQ